MTARIRERRRRRACLIISAALYALACAVAAGILIYSLGHHL